MVIWIVINIILFLLFPFYTVIFFEDNSRTKKFIFLNLTFCLLLHIVCVYKMKTLYTGILIIFIITLVYYICAYITYTNNIRKKIDRNQLILIWNKKSCRYVRNIIMLISIVVFIVNIIICKKSTVNVDSLSLCLTTLLGLIELIIAFNSKFRCEK